MKRSVKGALLSGLLFPGAGQLWLRRYLSGTVLILLVTGSLVVVVIKAASQAVALLEKAEAAGGMVDLLALANAAGRGTAASGDPLSKAALAMLAFCWLAGIVDAYLSGKRVDLAERRKKQQAASHAAEEER